ncbi:MAG: tetratricopeptide repeat protein [Candidatus Zixiibacteriota bacterium]
MYEKVKLSKRQIKEDKFTAFMLSSKKQMEENWQYYAIAAVVMVLLVVGIIYYLDSRSDSSNLAATQLAQATMQYRQGNSQVAILTLSDIVTKYGSTGFAEQATFLLGKINLETRNYEEAKLYFELYLEKYKEHELNRAASLAGLGVAFENQGRYDEAAAQFEKAVQEYPESALLSDLHYGAMRNYLMAGQSEKAKVHLDVITELFGGTKVATDAALLFYEKAKTS